MGGEQGGREVYGRRETRGRETGYLKGAGAGRNFATLAQYFAIGKAHGGGNCYGRRREPGVQGAGGGKLRSPCAPPPPTNKSGLKLFKLKESDIFIRLE